MSTLCKTIAHTGYCGVQVQKSIRLEWFLEWFPKRVSPSATFPPSQCCTPRPSDPQQSLSHSVEALPDHVHNTTIHCSYENPTIDISYVVSTDLPGRLGQKLQDRCQT